MMPPVVLAQTPGWELYGPLSFLKEFRLGCRRWQAVHGLGGARSARSILLTKQVMNDQTRRILHAIFTQPFSAVIAADDLKQVLQVLGADIDDRPGDRLIVRLRGRGASFRYGDRGLPVEEVVLVKQFLERCGIAPAGQTP
jgi:hypothetical protein